MDPFSDSRGSHVYTIGDRRTQIGKNMLWENRSDSLLSYT